MKAETPALPANEETRLDVMRRFALLEAQREANFDHLAALAADVTGCPIALVNLIDGTVQNTIGAAGLDLHCLPRGVSFCTRTILVEPPFVVRDARAHPLFRDNPLVTGFPGIRFYAGVPLVLDGARVGAFCLIDTAPRDVDADALRRLQHFAEAAERMLVARLASLQNAENQRRVETLHDAVPVAVAIYDAENRFVRSNARYRTLFLDDPQAVVPMGASFAEVLDQIEAAGTVLAVDGVTAGWKALKLAKRERGEPFHDIQLTSGSWLTCQETRGANGELLIAFSDVTDARQREHVLREQANTLRAILENIDHGIALFGTDARMIVCNELYGDLLGIPALPPAGGLTLIRIMQEFAARGVLGAGNPLSLLEETVAALGTPMMRRADIRTADGRTLVMTLAVLPDRRIVATCIDVTESKEVERMKDEFVSTVSHELRTPLTAISGSLGLLKGGAGGELSAKTGRLVDLAFRNAERLAQLVNDLLDIDKLGSGEMHLDRDVVDINELVRLAVETNQPYAARFGVTLTAELAPGPVKIEGDLRRLSQVAANLISNAVKYSPAGGDVRVIAAKVQGLGRFSVVDQGPGIPEHFRNKLFKRFAQADGSDRRSQEGTGLGLAITKAIVERHGGTIAFQTGEGRGTRFDIDFALFDPQALETGDALKRMVLICQQTDEAASAVRRIVARGHGVADVTTSLDEALSLVGLRHYDLVVLDATMRDRTGRDVLQKLRDEAGLGGAAIFLTSAADEDQTALRAQGINVVDWIEKPVDLPRIARALAQSTRREDAKCRILHVEDAPIITSVVAASLAELAHVDAAQDLATAREMLTGGDYDIMIVDVGLPDGSGLDLLQVASELPGRPIAVIVFSSVEDPDRVSPYVHKFLSKTGGTIAELVDTVRALSSQGEAA